MTTYISTTKKVLSTLIFTASISLNASVIDFESANNSSYIPSFQLPEFAEHFEAERLYVVNTTGTTFEQYYSVGVTSGIYTTYNSFGRPVTIELIHEGTFDFIGAYFTYVFNGPSLDDINIKGFAGDNLVFNNTFFINNHSPTWIDANYTDITRLVISPDLLGQRNQQWFAIDDFTYEINKVAEVPEPASIWLLGSSLLLLLNPKLRKQVFNK